MGDADQVASILGEWYAQQDDGVVTPPEEVIARHPDLGALLRARFEALGLLQCHFATRPQGAERHPPIPGYEIVREIGRGGMGLVYEAVQTSLGRSVALKVLSPAVTLAPKAVRRFQREAKAAARLHHTNIVPIYGMGREGGHWFYAMELVNGPSLNQVVAWMRSAAEARADDSLDGVELPERHVGAASEAVSAMTAESGSESHAWYVRVAEMFAGVADALELAHENGIVHRDVKPSNLMLSPDGALRMVDFGLASLEDPDEAGMTLTGEMLGTPLYMSPEQIRGSHDDVGPRSDIYALGASLYEVLTLKPPYDGKSLPELTTRILGTDAVLPRRLNGRIPRDLETIVLKALEKEPGRRYTTAAEMAADLRRFADGRVVGASRVGPLGRTWRRVKRHRTRALLVATVAIALVVGGLLGSRAMEEAERRRNAEYELLLGRAQEALALTATWDEEAEAGDLAVPDDTAARLLGQAIDLVPERPEAWWLRSLLAGRSAGERLRDLDEAGAHGLPPRTLHVARAGILEAEGRWAEAELHQRKASSHERRTAADAYYEAQMLAPGNRRDLADALFDEAVDASPRGGIIRSLALRARARRSMRKGELPSALRDLYALVALGDESAAVHVAVAAVYHRMGKDAVAREQFAALRERTQEDGSAAAWKALCVACRSSGLAAWHDESCALALKAHPEEAQLVREKMFAERRAGRPEASLALAQKTVQLRPEVAQFHEDLARAHFALGHDDEALAAYGRAIELQGERPSAASEHGRGRIFARKGNAVEALKAYRRAIDLNPRSVVTQYCIGLTLSELGRPKEALAAYEKALAIDDRYVWTHVNMGELLYRAFGRHEDALAAFDRAEALTTRLVNVHWGRGVVLLGMRRYEKALASFDEALRIDAKHGPSHHNRGLALTALGRPQEALVAIEAAIALGVDDSPVHNAHGHALQLLGKDLEARKAYDRAIERDPENAGAWRNRGSLRHSRFHDAKGALEDMEKAIALGARDAATLRNKGLCLASLREVDDALAAFTEAIEADDTYVDAYVSRGALRHDGKHDHEGALSDFERALQLDATHLNANVFRGVALQSLGRYDEAYKAYTHAIALAPANPMLRQRRGILLLHFMRKPREALAEFDAMLAMKPLLPAAHGLKATAHRALYEYEHALEALAALLALAPNHARALFDRADIQLELGRYAQALEGFKALRTIRPGHLPHHLAIVHVARESGAWAEVIESCDLGGKHFPGSLSLAAARVHALRATGKQAEALNAARARLEQPVTPKRSTDYVNHAYLLAVAGEAKRAHAALAAAGDYSHGDACVERARVHAVLGEREAVLEWLGRAAALDYRISPLSTPEPEFAPFAGDEAYKRLDRRIRRERHAEQAD